MRRPFIALACVLMAASAACGPSPDAAPLPVVHDSAGIRIVKNARTTSDRPAVRIRAEPAVTIGVVSGEAALQLNGVVGATRLGDGRIVIANGGTRELRFFTAGGRHVRTAGGRGQGPGEFRWLQRLDRLPGDTLVASDLSPGRLLWFDSAGTYLSMTNHEIRGNEIPIILADASLLLPFYESASFGNEFELFAVGRRTADPDGAFRPLFDLARLHRNGLVADTIGRFPGEELFKVHVPGTVDVTWYMPFARRTLYTASGDQVWTLHSSRPEFAVYGLDGELRMRVRFPSAPVPVANGDRTAFRASVEPRINPNRRADFERWFADVPYAETKAVATALLAGPEGTVWLQRPVPFGAASDVWSVFARDGTLLGDVALPAGTEPLEIGGDYLLALWRDALDVEFVRMYRIDRA